MNGAFTVTPPSSPTVAVILPVFNEAARLDECLAKLLAHPSFDEIIVVDGGSTDASAEIVCKHMAFDAADSRPVPALLQAPR